MKKRINIELLLGISATFLSLAALIVSIFQTRIAREQQQASVWPYLKTDYSQLNDTFTLYIVNNGVGPALVKKVTVYFNGKIYKSHIELFESIVAQTHRQVTIDWFYRTLKSGDVLKAGERLDLLQISNDLPTVNKLSKIVSTQSNFRLEIIYSDVYGNCWQLNGDKVTPVDRCSD